MIQKKTKLSLLSISLIMCSNMQGSIIQITRPDRLAGFLNLTVSGIMDVLGDDANIRKFKDLVSSYDHDGKNLNEEDQKIRGQHSEIIKQLHETMKTKIETGEDLYSRNRCLKEWRRNSDDEKMQAFRKAIAVGYKGNSYEHVVKLLLTGPSVTGSDLVIRIMFGFDVARSISDTAYRAFIIRPSTFDMISALLKTAFLSWYVNPVVTYYVNSLGKALCDQLGIKINTANSRHVRHYIEGGLIRTFLLRNRAA